MKIRDFTLLMIFTFAGLYSYAQKNIKLKQFDANKPVFSQQKVQANTVIYSVNLAQLQTQQLQTPEGIFFELRLNGFHKNYLAGKPALPKITKLIWVESNQQISFTNTRPNTEIIVLNNHEINYLLVPAQASVSKSATGEKPFVQDKNTYSTDDFYSEELITIHEVGIMRNKKLYRLEISPIAYNPVKNQLQIFNNFNVEVQIHPDTEGAKYQTKAYSSPFFGLSEFNQRQKKSESKSGVNAVKYVVVANHIFKASLQPFVQWKTQQGFQVVEAYTDQPEVGTTTTTIKAYLKDLYENVPAGEQAPSFVLFVGDVEQLPAFDGQEDNHVTDLYYCEYTGDMLPEVFYGRFSAQTTQQLDAQINKTLKYEKSELPDYSHLAKSLLIAGVDSQYAPTHGNSALQYIVENYLNASNNNTPYVYYYGSGSAITSDQSAAEDAIIRNLDEGVGIANYTAHCSPSGWADPAFSNSNVPNMQNEHKYGLMIGNCCESSRFEQNSFGEEVLRIENKGAIGYIGGSNSTYWDEDFYWACGVSNLGLTEANADLHTYANTRLGAYDRYFHTNNEAFTDWYVTQGQINIAGNMAVEESTSSRKAYYWEIYHLMGDPSLIPHFKIPEQLTATSADELLVGQSQLSISSEPYCYVGLTQQGQLIAAGTTDAQGNLTLTFDELTLPGQNILKLVVSGQNYKHFEKDITVTPQDGPYAVLDAYTIIDNHNQMPENAESFHFNFDIKNLGNQTATTVVATLSTTSTAATITNNQYTFNNLAAGATATSAGAFNIVLADGIEDQTQIPFSLAFNDGSQAVHSSTFYVTINAPKLEINYTGFSDAKGNNDGIIDAAETIDLSFTLKNTGHNVADNIEFELSNNSSWVTLTTNNATYTQLPVGEQTLTFEAKINENAQKGDFFMLHAKASNSAYSTSIELGEKVGQIMETWEDETLDNFAWQLNGQADWFITGDYAYEGKYAIQSGTIDNEMATELMIHFIAEFDDKLSFYRKVSTEPGYDYLTFYIDGEKKDEWSGELDWSQVEYDIAAGEHTAKWVYKKDESVEEGLDAAWLDNIVLPTMHQTQAPVFTSPNNFDAQQYTDFEFALTASDSDSPLSNLTFGSNDKPDWLSLQNNGDGTALLIGNSPDVGQLQFTVWVSDNFSRVTQAITLNVQESTSDINSPNPSLIRVYPNPTTEFVHVNSALQINDLQVFDNQGKLIQTWPANQKILDLKKFTKGIYFLKIATPNQNYSIKIIVQ